MNVGLYRLNQENLIKYIKRELDKKEIGYTEYEGNLYSMVYPTRPLFVAHMDVADETILKYPVEIKNNRLKRKERKALGAASRAGVELLLDNIEDINFCFVKDKYKGSLGAEDLLKQSNFMRILLSVPCTIEMDCFGDKNKVTYCSETLENDIDRYTQELYTSIAGDYTDIAVWEHYVPGVSLSTGFYNENTQQEFLDLKQFDEASDTIKVLNRRLEGLSYKHYLGSYWEGCQYKKRPVPKVSTAARVYSYDDYDEYDVPEYEPLVRECSECHITEKFMDNFYDTPMGILCEDCLKYNFGIERIYDENDA